MVTAPIEWLLSLSQSPNGYQALVADAGSLAVAAYRVARARCLTLQVATPVPTRSDVRAAAREIATRIGWSAPLPASSALAFDCEAAGLPVL